MKVWVYIVGNNADYDHVVKVFSTRESAEERLRQDVEERFGSIEYIEQDDLGEPGFNSLMPDFVHYYDGTDDYFWEIEERNVLTA